MTRLRSAAPTIILVLLAVFTTAFAFINYTNKVKVWPLNSYQPLSLVIGVAFVLGLIVGALLWQLIRYRPTFGAGPTREAPPLTNEPHGDSASRR